MAAACWRLERQDIVAVMPRWNVMVIALNGGFGQRTRVADNKGVKGASTCHN